MKIIFILLSLFVVNASANTNSCLGLFLKDETLLTENFSDYKIRDLSVKSLAGADFFPSDRIYSLLNKSEVIGKMVHDLSAAKPVEKVVYLAAGFEAGPAFKLFPDALTYIAIDNHPFVNRNVETILAQPPPAQSSMFTHFEIIDEYVVQGGNMAAALVGSLQVAFPELRLHRVAEFQEADGASNGWIDFDTGPGTPLRRYIHINHYFNAQSPWRTILPEQGFDGLLIKGSIEIFRDYNTGAFDLVKHISSTQGVIVDADNRMWDLFQWDYQNLVLSREAQGLTEQSIEVYETPAFNVYFTNTQVGYVSDFNDTRYGTKIITYK